jgi:hypothetical protein
MDSFTYEVKHLSATICRRLYQVLFFLLVLLVVSTASNLAVYEANAGGGLVVTDPDIDAVFRVDPDTGDRTIISDDVTGTGPSFITPYGIAVESDGSLVVIDSEFFQAEVYRVNPPHG